jgi:MoxR-like ATPase
MHQVATQLGKIRDELSTEFFERRQVIDFIILTLMCKQHGFILGPPGTAKSELIRAFVARLTNMDQYFEALLSRTRPDQALLGPWNLPELRDKGDFKRKVSGFLPTAIIAFLDEVGKMSPTSGHDLLSILNERLYHEVNGGRSAQPVPLYTCFTASNELIIGESDDAAALWDRLLMRCVVDYIQETSNFVSLMSSVTKAPNPNPTTVEWAEVADAIDNVVPKIDLPTNVIETVIRLRGELSEQGIVVSDRRWKQSMRVLQANAFLAGRTEVLDDDVSVLRYTLWDEPSHIEPVERLTLTVSNPEAEKLLEMIDMANEIQEGINERRERSIQAKAQYGAEINPKLKAIKNDLAQMRQDALAAGRGTTKLDETKDRLDTVHRSIYIDCLGMEPENVTL